jgi:dienelactone hydrolase
MTKRAVCVTRPTRRTWEARLKKEVLKHVGLLAMVVFLSACGPAATPTQIPEPTPAATLASLPGVGYVYGDPGGRFTLPLIGDWTPVETDGSYAQFTLADPVAELYVVTVESGDLQAGVDAALAQIGIQPSALSLLSSEPSPLFPDWSLYAYSLDDGPGVSLAARLLDGATVTLIMTCELDDLGSERVLVQVGQTLDGFATLPLPEYLHCGQASPPITVEAIENLNYIEFCSGGQSLMGRLSLPGGEGPFPAVVHVSGGSGRRTRWEYSPSALTSAGFAVFTYDKRGVRDSEGLFVEATAGGIETSEWRLPQLVDDALAAVAFLQNLQEINPDQIGLWGASQHGWTIPLAASRSDAPAFAVIVAGATVSVGEEVYYSDLTGDTQKHPGAMTDSELEELSKKLAEFDGERGFDPHESIEAMQIPAVWVWGARDQSIPVRESKAILDSIIVEHDKHFTILLYPDADHGIPEYLYFDQVLDWIRAHLEE